MSVYPLYLVLGSDGTIGAYAREDILKIDLAQNLKAGEPARQVYELDHFSMTVTYRPSLRFSELVLPFENMCPRHRRDALPAPSVGVCELCAAEQKAKGQGA